MGFDASGMVQHTDSDVETSPSTKLGSVLQCWTALEFGCSNAAENCFLVGLGPQECSQDLEGGNEHLDWMYCCLFEQ